MSVPAGQLRFSVFVLFGLPVLLALICCIAADLTGLSSPLQGGSAVAGFILGALTSYRLRTYLQDRFVNLLSLSTVYKST